ncbi:hypothetical protein M407DRAFT_18739 [Tulasnella calospora MUT 4182]|uniref:Uncharacterized protein n=1 Tax=Tulasnella calospora MUT 4182 TaxID=1051891 RepID=A0A0C3QJH0_9AGAM|nr:hypothetical protein M407DRAFT_18739 [Tulasnella calospora MUT 4182]
MGDPEPSTAEVWVPSLIGGFPTQDDRVPSILLLVLFICSLSPWIKRQFDPNTRTITLGFATFVFAMGQIPVFTFRGFRSHHHEPGEILGEWMTTYQQLAFAVGYTGLMLDLVSFARVVLVNATLEDQRRGSRDRPTLRGKIRRLLWYLGFLLSVVSGLGSVVYSILFVFTQRQDRADRFWHLRYASDALPLIIILTFIGGLLYIRPRLEFLDKPAVDALVKLSLTLAIVPIYRLTVLHYKSPSMQIFPSEPFPASSLTPTRAKVVFYICHILPGVLVVYYIHFINIRAKFNAGPYGDWYHNDKKNGIPQLREEGVLVEGVGVGPIAQPKKPTIRWWLKFLFIFESRPSRTRDAEKDDFDPDRESLLTLVPTRSVSGDKSDKAWW